MFGPNFPPVVAILLQIALNDALQKYSARFFVLKKQFVDLSLVSDFFLRLDALTNFDSGSMEHLVVALEYPHHRLEHSSVHCQCFGMRHLSDQLHSFNY
jgi:hypothetical protein